MARNDGQENLDCLLTVPIQPRHEFLLGIAAVRSDRKVATWIRWLILRELQDQGLIDQQQNPLVDEQGRPLERTS
jgi:hypothetical protein